MAVFPMLPDERTTHNNAVTLPAHVEALVVAPARDIARPIISFLRQEGIEVRVADEFDAAFEEALMHPPDVVLIDDSVSGKRGVELCERLKGSVRTHFVPTILLMPDGEPELRLRAIAGGADAVFLPSVDAVERRTRLWALLRTRALFRRIDRKQRHQGTEISERRRWLAYLLHDLQGSIGAITANIEFLAQFAPAKEDRRRRDFDEAVQDANIVLDQLLRSVRTVLDFDRFEAGTLAPALAPMRIGDLLREVVTDLGRNPALAGEIELVPGGEEPLLRIDAQLMRNALVNLLMHCLKYASGKTIVRVSSRRRAAVCVELSCAGLRFSEADKFRIFEPYSHLDDRPIAYGMGLALARAVVESHGGEIWVENGPLDENAGSFLFSLPAMSAEPRRGRRLA
ncbi:MAG TPA: ATP-binding protein [Polyangia bacterium]